MHDSHVLTHSKQYVDHIDLEDLHDASSMDGILLNIQQTQRFFEGAVTNDNHDVEGVNRLPDNLI